jgi:adenylosuccinate synthase
VAGKPIAMVSTGPERDETILLQHPFQDWWKIFDSVRK